jgi:hypothetical protein
MIFDRVERQPVTGAFQKADSDQVNGLDLNGAYGGSAVTSGIPPRC